ncbi:MAG: FAD-binding protein [Chloroflexi bacterium]|nr:FAD-binding protein [Chloroflexota bacterium]
MNKLAITRALANIVGAPFFVVIPENAEQISQVVKLAREHHLAIVPRGAGTGLCGGTTPLAGGVMISLTRMKKIFAIDYENRVARVGAGLVNLDLSNALAARGFFYAPDPGSQAASTIGGNIAANSGGPHCLAYGVTANHVLGLEIVLDNGEIVWVGGEAPGAPGYDLVGAVIGSEGTFGIITQALVKILPLPEEIRTLLAIFDSVERASHAVSAIIAAGIIPAALEMLDAISLRAVENAMHVGYPTDAGAVLLIEIDGAREGLDELQTLIGDICREFESRELRVAQTKDARAELWRGRKHALPALGRLAPNYYIQDGCVPRSKLPHVLAEIETIAKKYDLVIANFFHAGDGNLHPNILFDLRQAGAYERVIHAGKEILQLCVDAGGTISGEHGIGMEKMEYMPLIFSDADLGEMKKLRAAICPSGLFNPCKIIPHGASCAELFSNNLSRALAASGDMWI